MVNPLERPKVVSIPNRIPAFKRLLCADNYYNGSIDIIIIDKNLSILRNRDGALLDLQGNRKINGEIIAGPFCVIEFDEHGFITSLSQENIRKYSKYFWNIENFTDREVLLSYWEKFEEEINSLEWECTLNS